MSKNSIRIERQSDGREVVICVCAAEKSAAFVEGSTACSFVGVIDMAFMVYFMLFMVYFMFFVCILTPLVAMFLIYGYIFSVVRRHIAAMIQPAPPAVSMATVAVQLQDPAPVSQSASSTTGHVTGVDGSTAPAARQGSTSLDTGH